MGRGWSKLRTLMRRHFTFRTVTVVVAHRVHAVSIAAPFEIRAVTTEIVDDARAMDPRERIEEFRAFLARGDLGFYAYRDGRVVHRAWVRRGPASVMLWHSYGVLSLGEGEAYIHYCETHPEARGLGAYPAVLSHIGDRLEREGAREILISTTADNIPSMSGIARAGFEELRRIRLRVRFGIECASELEGTRLATGPHV